MKVPNHQPRDFLQRLLELISGLLPFAFLAAIVVLSRFAVKVAAIVMLIYTLLWLIRLIGYGWRLAGSFYYLKLATSLDWHNKLADIELRKGPTLAQNRFWRKRAENWYRKLLASGVEKSERLDPDEIYHAVIIAVYNEPSEIIEQTIKAVRASDYDHQKVILLVAYEARAGAKVERSVQKLIKKYGAGFKLAKAIKHPDDISGEAKAKAGNITHAAKYLSNYCREERLKPENVLVTTLDADNRPHSQYLAGLAWTYCLAASRTKRSYQPLPLFNNNIWDAPALTRVVATDSSFWFMMGAMRPKRLRIFSAHAQPLKTLQNTDYWNVESLVEDGHQYWRTYFACRGDHWVLPVWLPISQDAVNLDGWWRSVRAQFVQLRRWAWGVADTPWLLRQSFRDKSVSWPGKLRHISWQLDDYITWATAPIILAIGGWLPFWLAPHPEQSLLALRLPYFISGLQLIALVCLIVPVVASYLSLPPRPKRYGRVKNLSMLLQWILEPVALICFVSFASLNAHLRLIFNKPLEKFNVTSKHRVGQ